MFIYLMYFVLLPWAIEANTINLFFNKTLKLKIKYYPPDMTDKIFISSLSCSSSSSKISSLCLETITATGFMFSFFNKSATTELLLNSSVVFLFSRSMNTFTFILGIIAGKIQLLIKIIEIGSSIDYF